MNKFSTIFSASVMALMIVFCSTNVNAQNKNGKSSTTQEAPISNTDLIKLATKAPFADSFNTPQEYGKAKETWASENPDARKRLKRGGTAQGSQTGNTSQEEMSEHKSKEAWINANPDEYARMVKEGSGAGSVPWK